MVVPVRKADRPAVTFWLAKDLYAEFDRRLNEAGDKAPTVLRTLLRRYVDATLERRERFHFRLESAVSGRPKTVPKRSCRYFLDPDLMDSFYRVTHIEMRNATFTLESLIAAWTHAFPATFRI